jgi:hypothetical protein
MSDDTASNPPQPPPNSSIILYQTEDGRTRIECRFEAETLWLSQPLMAELFQTTQQNVSLHLQNIYEEGELEPGATHKEYLLVQREGSRDVQRRVSFYSLPAILSVGYRGRPRTTAPSFSAQPVSTGLGAIPPSGDGARYTDA